MRSALSVVGTGPQNRMHVTCGAREHQGMAGTDGDLDVLRAWWAGLAPSVPPETRGLWFGMVDLVEGAAAVRHLYVAGCPVFDPDDEGDWACEYCWWPAGRYVLLPGLASLPDRPYQAVLGAAADLVRRLEPAAGVEHVEGVAVGFDDGDFEIVWAQHR